MMNCLRTLIYLHYWHECIEVHLESCVMYNVISLEIYSANDYCMYYCIVLVINLKLHEHDFYFMHNYNFSLWHSSYFATCLINVKSILRHRDRCATFDPNSGLWYIYISIFYFIAFQSDWRKQSDVSHIRYRN